MIRFSWHDGGSWREPVQLSDPSHPVFASWGPEWVLQPGQFPKLAIE